MRSILIALILGLGVVPSATAEPPQQAQRADLLAKQRATNLARLAAYLEAGELASDAEGRPASVFRDAKGRLCPMAYLMAVSGRMDLVDEVVRTNNRLQLADVTDGPLLEWMAASGLTREEIIRIQGIPRDGFFLEQRERQTITAQAPTPARLKAAAIKKGKALLRDFAIHNAQSLAVAESRRR